MEFTITVTDKNPDGEKKTVQPDQKPETDEKRDKIKTKSEEDGEAEQKKEIRNVILEYNREVDLLPGNDDAKRRLQYLCTAEKYRQLDAYLDNMKQRALKHQISEDISFKDIRMQGKTATAETREKWVTENESGEKRSYEMYNSYELTLIRNNWMIERTRNARLQNI